MLTDRPAKGKQFCSRASAFIGYFSVDKEGMSEKSNIISREGTMKSINVRDPVRVADYPGQINDPQRASYENPAQTRGYNRHSPYDDPVRL
jgi:hypothetical protein